MSRTETTCGAPRPRVITSGGKAGGHRVVPTSQKLLVNIQTLHRVKQSSTKVLALTTTNHNACAHDTNTSRLRTWQQAKSSTRIAASQNACEHDTKPSRLRAWQQAKTLALTTTKPTRLCEWQHAKSSAFAAASQVVFAHGSILGAAQPKEFWRSLTKRI